VSHIPQLGHATTSPAGDVDVCASLKEMIHLQWETTTSPEGDAVCPIRAAFT